MKHQGIRGESTRVLKNRLELWESYSGKEFLDIAQRLLKDCGINYTDATKSPRQLNDEGLIKTLSGRKVVADQRKAIVT